MQLLRLLAWPFVMLALFIMVTVLGLVTGGAGWVALSLLCVWPVLGFVTGWTIRGLKDSYRLVAKQTAKREREVFG